MAWIEETGKTISDETNVALEATIKKFGASSASFTPSKRLRCAANTQFYFSDYKNFTIDFWLGVDRNTTGGILSIGAGAHSVLSLQLDGIGGLKWLSGNTTASIGTAEICDFTQKDTNLTGIVGNFSDGTYIYYSPTNNGLAIRIPINNFSPSAIEICDLTAKDTRLKGYVGGFITGGYAYYVPYSNGMTRHGLAIRIPINNFVYSAIEICDFTQYNASLKGYNNGFTDGTYAYYVPYDNVSLHGLAVRIPINNFSPSAIEICDLTSKDTRLKGYVGGFITGGYAYYVPYNNGSPHGLAIRIPTNNFVYSAIEICDFTQYNASLKGYNNGFTDGTYAYYAPFNNGSFHGLAVRVPVNNFVYSAVEICDFPQYNASLKGYVGGFITGGYAYYAPYNNGSPHGLAIRIPTNNFVYSAIETCDFTQYNASLKGYQGVCVEGNYIYYAPNNNGSPHGLGIRLPLNKWTNSKIVCGSGYIRMAYIAWVRKYGIDYLYVDGILQDTNNSVINYGNGDLYINDKPDGSYSGTYIYIDELAIRDYPVFNGNFTPPSSPYTYP